MKASTWLCTVTLALVAAPGVGGDAERARPGEGTEILWDTWGVPHIFAERPPDLFRAFGWAQMHSHGDLLLRLYGMARGRGAEFFGEVFASEPFPTHMLAFDRAVRTMGLPRRARSWHRAQDPRFRMNLDAFAAGINAYAAAHPDRLAPNARAVLPVDGTDVLAHALRVFFSFQAQACADAFEPELLDDLLTGGSNGWAIAPSRTRRGHALLLANPHLAWYGANTLYEAQLSVAGGYEAYGATLVGLPVLAIAFGDTHGWTHTVNPLDACDVYQLTPGEGGYVFDGVVRAFETRGETIKVKQDDGGMREERLRIRRSVHGPVFERQGRTLAVRMAGVDRLQTPGALQQWWDMSRARSVTAFQRVLRRLELPLFNVVYADHRGHILLLFGGRTPVRPVGDAAYWSGIVPGDTSANLWTRSLPYSALPKALDPPHGWVQNSNSVPWFMTEPSLDPSRYPSYLAPPGPVFLREQRGIQLLKGVSRFSLEALVEAKHSTRALLADRVLDDLQAAVLVHGGDLARQAAEVLVRWDRQTEASSAGAVLFALWHALLVGSGDIYAVPWDARAPLQTPRGLADPVLAAEALEQAAALLQDLTGRLDTPFASCFASIAAPTIFPPTAAETSWASSGPLPT